MSPRHVLFLHPALHFSSATDRVFHFARHLVASGDRVTIVSTPGSRADAFTKMGIQVVYGELPERFAANPFAFGRSRRLVHELAPDLVYATSPSLAPLAAKMRIPYVLEVARDVRGPLAKSAFLRGVVLCGSTLVESAVNRGGLPRDLMRVIEHGPAPCGPPLLSGFQPEATLRVGCAEALDSEHDARAFLEAARILVLEGTRPMHFFVFGEGPFEEPLRRMIRDLAIEDRATITSHAGRSTKLLESLDIYVSTLHEGEPGWLTHSALMLGLPSILTAVGGAFALVEDGRSGLLIERGDPRALADAIGRLARSPEEARAMGTLARRRMLHAEASVRMKAELDELFSDVLTQSALS